MNGNNFFNNQFNSQFNNQPVNNGEPMPEVREKKKFFSSAFMNNNNGNINDVGGTNSSSNNSVVAWGLNSNLNNVSQFQPNNQNNMGMQQNIANFELLNKQPNRSSVSSSFSFENNGMPLNQMGATSMATGIFDQGGQQSMMNPSMMNQGIQQVDGTQFGGQVEEHKRMNFFNKELLEKKEDNVSLNDNNQVVNEQNGMHPKEYPSDTEQLDLNEGLENSNASNNSNTMEQSTNAISQEALEMLQDVNGTVVFEEPEVLEDIELPELKEEKKDEVKQEEEEVEKLDVLEEGLPKRKIEVPKIDQGIPDNTISMGGVKPQAIDNAGIASQGLGALAAGVVAGGVASEQILPQATMQNSAIFQASMQSNNTNTNVQTVVDNSPVEPWMANQPLSAGSIANSSAPQNTVMSANQREELERKKTEGNIDTTPVPEDVTKKQVSTDIREELLVKEYVGGEYQSIVMSPFSFGALIFGGAYFAYRKMYLLGIINIAIALALLFFVPMKYNFLALAGFHLLMALTVNKIYLIHVKLLAKRAKKSNSKKQEPKNQANLEEIMRIRGRASVVNAALAICIFVAGIFFLSKYVLKDNSFSKFLTKSVGLDKIVLKKIEYQGTINYDENIDINDYVSLNIPDGFVKNDSKYIDYVYTTDGIGTYNQCMLKIGIVSGFSDGNSFIAEMASYNEEEQKVKTLETKGITWTNYYTQDDSHEIFYKGTTVSDKAVVLEYRKGKDSTDGVCDTYFYTIMDSIEVKEK